MNGDHDPAASLVPAIGRHLWLQLLANAGWPTSGVHYLPPTRSGILAALDIYTAVAIQAIWQGGGTSSLVVPAFSGVDGEFLQVLSTLRTSNRQLPATNMALIPVLDLLNNRVLAGTISVSKDCSQRISVIYEQESLRLPLPRASSMVAELAPLALYLTHVLKPGDVLFFDEPETHLHPENQRHIARVLVRLVRAGVRVVCPTHSSLILHQVSNHMIASQLDPADLAAKGWTDNDVLRPDEIGAFLFEPREDGTHISPVEIDPEFGIDEDEFVRVSEEIGQETSRLARAREGALAAAS